MPLLIAVEIRDLAHDFLVPPPSLASDLRCIDSRGQGGGILGFPGTPLVLVPLFLVLPSLIERLGILSGGERWALRSLGVIPASYCSLCLDFMRNGVSGLTPSENLEIGFLHVETRS